MNLLLHSEYDKNQTRDTKLKSLKAIVLDGTLLQKIMYWSPNNSSSRRNRFYATTGHSITDYLVILSHSQVAYNFELF